MTMTTNVGQQGWAQGTAAMQALMRAGLGVARRASSPRRRKKASASAARPKKRSASSRATRPGSRLKKGSAAAKAWMAKIRKMRKR